MIDKRITEITTKLDYVFSISESIAEDEVKAHFTKYLCVLASGYIEESIKIIVETYTTNKSSPKIFNFVNKRISKVTNINCEKIESLLLSFSKEWAEEFIRIISDEEKDAIDSIVANRNNIAHGRTVGISYIRLQEWYKNTKIALRKLRSILGV